MNATETIKVYAENCVLAGRQVSQGEIEERGESSDWVTEELTEENAAWHDAKNSRYHWAVARTIREAMGVESAD